MADELPLEFDDLRVRLVPSHPGHMVIAESEDEQGATTTASVPEVTSPLSGDGWLAAAEKIGSTLFKAVFRDEVREVYIGARTTARDEDRGLRLRLNLTAAPDLAVRPWELLFDGGEFLAISGRTSLVRTLDVPSPLRPPDIRRRCAYSRSLLPPSTSCPSTSPPSARRSTGRSRRTRT